MGNRISNIAFSLVVVAGITALVLPKRQTPAVIASGGTAFAKVITAAQGR